MLSHLIPRGLKNYVKRKIGAPDIFMSLDQLKSLGFSPRRILDVGAYEGQWTTRCLEIFPAAEYMMVEAMQKKAVLLRRVVDSHTNVELVIAVLGAADGLEVEFSEVETASSVLEEVVTSHKREKRTITSLNTLMGNHGVTAVDLIKLDVQGYELEVLKGFDRFLPLTQVVLIEASLLDIHKNAPLIRDVINFMFDHGFMLYDICSVDTRRPLDNALWQTDLLFVKENSLFRADKRYDH